MMISSVCKSVVLHLLIASVEISLISVAAAAQYEGGGAIQAIDEKPADAVRRSNSETSEARGASAASRIQSTQQKKNGTIKTQGTAPRPVSTAVPATKYNGPVAGDTYTFLNFEIAEKVPPVWTEKAKSAGALGLVQVAVLIGTDGRVLQARARSGNPLLYPESETAALATTFNRPILNGRPVRALGFVVYRFGTEEQEYEQEQKNKLDRNGDGEGVIGPVEGGVLNGKTISMPKPIYPPDAKAAGAKGQVIVQVIVDENGKVTSAYALSGDPLLRDAAEKAARLAKLSPIRANGKPALMYGTLVYNFTP